MKYRFLLSAFCNLVIGFVGISATVSAPQAADIGMPVLTKGSASTMAVNPQISASALDMPSHLNEKSRNAKGPQGPIRTDFSDQTAKADAETLRRDLQMNRYPMSNRIGIP